MVLGFYGERRQDAPWNRRRRIPADNTSRARPAIPQLEAPLRSVLQPQPPESEGAAAGDAGVTLPSSKSVPPVPELPPLPELASLPAAPSCAELPPVPPVPPASGSTGVPLTEACSTHCNPATQSASESQAVLHSSAVEHWYPPQEVAGPARHWPLPSQVLTDIALFTQLRAQLTADPGNVQPVRFVPSQMLAQSPCPPHAGLMLGSPVTGRHCPSVPGRLHASHWPGHALLQHTPSTQKAESHASLELQLAPTLPVGLHAPWSQTLPFTHCAEFAQGSAHPDPTHRYGEQSVPPLSLAHCPRPLQISPFATLPWQADLPQDVLCA